MITDKAYLSAITVTKTSKEFLPIRDGGKNQLT